MNGFVYSLRQSIWTHDSSVCVQFVTYMYMYLVCQAFQFRVTIASTLCDATLHSAQLLWRGMSILHSLQTIACFDNHSSQVNPLIVYGNDTRRCRIFSAGQLGCVAWLSWMSRRVASLSWMLRHAASLKHVLLPTKSYEDIFKSSAWRNTDAVVP